MILVAGVGDIFHGDDAFGVEVARALLARPAARPLDGDARVVDFGVRGYDLALALLGGPDQAPPELTVIVDAVQRGGPPGTLYVIDPSVAGTLDAPPDAHSLHPANVLRLVEALGGPAPLVRIVGCEPLTFGTDLEPSAGLSEPVRAAVEPAIELVLSLVARARGGELSHA